MHLRLHSTRLLPVLLAPHQAEWVADLMKRRNQRRAQPRPPLCCTRTKSARFFLWGGFNNNSTKICRYYPEAEEVYGKDVDLTTARAGGLAIGLQLLSTLRTALGGDLGRVRQVVMVRGFVTAAPGMGDYPKVINACSELFIALWGENGRHARTSIGVAQLPLDATVEIDAVFAVD